MPDRHAGNNCLPLELTKQLRMQYDDVKYEYENYIKTWFLGCGRMIIGGDS